jgi:chemotaxis protein methyltransferase CheR
MTNQQNHKLGYGDYVRFRDLVLARSGLNFSEKKRTDLEFGLLKALQDAPQGMRGDINAYFHYLNNAATPQAQAEIDRLVNLLTVGETHFFRNEAQFDALAKEVLPLLIARKRKVAAAVGVPPAIPQLRIWSAGCATGEEAYSLAILLQELIADIQEWQILILATDINYDSLARAREAHYSNWSFREPRALAIRPHYFKQQGNRFKLREDIRSMVTFARHNLIEDPFPALQNNTGAMDLIICRNVTIYFAEDTTRRVVQNFYESLVPGGWFVVGHSEPSLTIYRAFQSHTFSGALLYQKRAHGGDNAETWQWPEWQWPELNGTKPLSPSVGTTIDLAPKPIAAAQQPPPAAAAAVESAAAVVVGRAPPGHPDEGALVQLIAGPGNLTEEMALLIEENLSQLPDALCPPAFCQLARFYANRGHWQTAQKWCQEAIARDNLCSEAYFLQAMVYEHQEQLETAANELRKVIYISADEPRAHLYLAMLHRRLGRSEPARRALTNVIRILSRWPPEKIVPDSNGRRANELLDTCRRLLESGLPASALPASAEKNDKLS